MLKQVLCILGIIATSYSQAQSYFQPYEFVQNSGEWSEPFRYRAEIAGAIVFVSRDRIVFSLGKKGFSSAHPHQQGEATTTTVQKVGLQLEFLNSHGADPIAKQKTGSQYHFFFGENKMHFESYRELLIPNLYDNIDVRIYFEEGQIKYDFVVHPGGNPQDISVKYTGHEGLETSSAGNLEITTALGKSYELLPHTYMSDHKSKVIQNTYRVKEDVVSFKVASYNTSETLIIDPELVFSTSSGSFADNWGNTACTDEEGNAYAGGTVFSTTSSGSGSDVPSGFPTTFGAFQDTFQGEDTDIGILKFDPSGQNLLYATYIGGNESEIPVSTIVDPVTKELVILSVSSSLDFPGTVRGYDRSFNGGFRLSGDFNCSFSSPGPLVGGYDFDQGTDMVVTKLSEDGSSISASTYLGGSGNDGILYTQDKLVNNYGDQVRGDVYISEEGDIWVASSTRSTDYPLVDPLFPSYGGGSTDAVISRFDNSLGTLKFSTFIGGSEEDVLFSIKSEGDYIYFTGGSNGTDLPVIKAKQPNLAGEVDGILGRLRMSDNQLISLSYNGTDRFDQIYFLDVKGSSVYLYGQTKGVWPVSPPSVYSRRNAGNFIQAMDTTLQTTLFSTVIGNSTFDMNNITPSLSPTAFGINDCDNIYIAGWGGETNRVDRIAICFGAEVNYSSDYNGGNTYGLPTTADAYQRTTDGSDFYIAAFTGDMDSLLYATFFGGSSSQEHVDGGTSRVSDDGVIFQNVCAN